MWVNAAQFRISVGRYFLATSVVAAHCARPLLLGQVIECGLLSGLYVRQFSEAAGRDGDQRSGSTSVSRARLLAVAIWFSRSGSFRSFAHGVVGFLHLFTLYRMRALRSVYSRSGHRDPVVLLFCHHCPDGARHFVSQGNRYQHARLSCQHPLQPGTLRDT